MPADPRTDRPQPSQPAAAPGHRERLGPSPGVWAVVPLLGVVSAVALLPIGTTVGVVGALLVVAALVVWGVVSTPVVAVVDGDLVAGGARIPVDLLGEAVAARGEQARQQRGPGLDARAHLLIRGWIDPVVRVELRDPQDPTPYWLLSSRRPEELVAALQAARG